MYRIDAICTPKLDGFVLTTSHT